MNIQPTNNISYQNRLYVLTVSNGLVSTVFPGDRNETGIDVAAVILEKSGIGNDYNKDNGRKVDIKI